MSENLTATEWTSARGGKWSAHAARMEAMLTPVDGPLIDALKLDGPMRIADIGCGGGATTLEIARLAPASVVHGFDISPDSIGLARSRKPQSESRITFEVANLEAADPPAQPYHRLVSRFGIMFFTDPQAAFANLSRWLQPDGRFAFAVWGSPAENPWMSVVRQEVAKIVTLPSPDPEAPGPFRYADASKLLALLDAAGFRGLEVRTWRGVLSIGGGLPSEEAADFALASFSTFGELLAQAGDEALQRAQDSLTDRFSGHQQEGVVRFGASVHILTGTHG